jgi:hypothetical protein
MNYLIQKAAELIGGLTDIKHIYLYLNASGRSIQGYTSDLLIIDFNDSIRKLYKYNIIHGQFEYLGKTSRYLPIKVSNWIVINSYK